MPRHIPRYVLGIQAHRKRRIPCIPGIRHFRGACNPWHLGKPGVCLGDCLGRCLETGAAGKLFTRELTRGMPRQSPGDFLSTSLSVGFRDAAKQ